MLRRAVGTLFPFMSHDALNSPGFNAAKMSGERLDRMKAVRTLQLKLWTCPIFLGAHSSLRSIPRVTQCAHKAMITFPPPFVNKAQDVPSVATPEGDRILERGRWANAHRAKAPRDSGSTGRFGPGWPTAQQLDAELGGPDGFFTLCGLHYCNLFENPRMNVLFDTRDKDTAVSAMDHGKRIAATLLDETLGTRYFASLGRGGSGAFAVMGTHSKAKRCPMRPASQQVAMPKGHPRANRRFTTDQRDTWVGSHMSAAEECGASVAFQESYGKWLAMLVSAYAPFVDERTGNLDWMEESPY